MPNNVKNWLVQPRERERYHLYHYVVPHKNLTVTSEKETVALEEISSEQQKMCAVKTDENTQCYIKLEEIDIKSDSSELSDRFKTQNNIELYNQTTEDILTANGTNMDYNDDVCVSIIKTEIKIHQPNACDRFNCNTSYLENFHWWRHHQDVVTNDLEHIYQCDHCEFDSYSLFLLTLHNHNHNPNNYKNSEWHQCAYCVYKTNIKDNLRKHTRSQHWHPENIKWYQCAHCVYKSKKKLDLERHVTSQHTKPEDIKWH